MTAMTWFFPFRRPHSRRVSGKPERLFSSRRGATAIEFAMLFPVYLLMLMGVVEFGRLLWTQSTLQQAVEAAARCASVDPTTCGSPSATASYAASQMAGFSVSASIFTVPNPPPSCGNEVTASMPFTFVLQTLFPWTPTLSAQSCFPIQS